MSFLSIRNLSVRLRKGPPLLRRVSLEVAAARCTGWSAKAAPASR
jgi:peptide/nickel transport system ATP-binding protein